MGFWSELFGEPKCDPSLDVSVKSNGYVVYTAKTRKDLINKYQQLSKYADGDILVYKGLIHRLKGSIHSSFSIENCLQEVIFETTRVNFETNYQNILDSRFGISIVENVEIPQDERIKGAWKFVQDFINKGEIQQSLRYKIKSKIYGDIPSDSRRDQQQWFSINDGEYFTDSSNYLYKFEDWTVINDDEEMWEILKDRTVEKCDNPEKTHWKHFLHLEMVEKAKRDEEMKKWVDGILAKKIEYDDINFQYNGLPSAPIVDITSFRNFCELVHEESRYHDYEVSNYLMLLRDKEW